MSYIEKHFQKLETKARDLGVNEIFKYLLNQWYYPDRYVLPPCFSVNEFKPRKKPIYPVPKKWKWKKPEWQVTENVVFPKNDITDRIFWIIHPDIYHDLAYHISHNWDEINDVLFRKRKILCYSFPIPTETKLFSWSRIKRTERIIYEYIAMAEKDLVADALWYEYIVHTDIKNFYPSIYTHSIAWAMHWKDEIQKWQMYNYSLVWNILDALIFSWNWWSTNWIPIWSIVSDILAEIVLSDIDYTVSKELTKQWVDFKWVRFKDDYRILCKSNEDWRKILKILQKFLFRYNLSLNDDKTIINAFPYWLYRPWIIEYNSSLYSQKTESILSFKEFEQLYFHAINIHKKYPATQILKKFLWNILNKNEIKVHIKDKKDTIKFLGLIWNLRKHKVTCLPEILWIIEILLFNNRLSNKDLQSLFDSEIARLYDSKETLWTYEIIWLSYFIKKHELSFFKKSPLNKSTIMIFKCLNYDKNHLFWNISKSITKAKIYTKLDESKKNFPLILDYVGLFKNED